MPSMNQKAGPLFIKPAHFCPSITSSRWSLLIEHLTNRSCQDLNTYLQLLAGFQRHQKPLESDIRYWEVEEREKKQPEGEFETDSRKTALFCYGTESLQAQHCPGVWRQLSNKWTGKISNGSKKEVSETQPVKETPTVKKQKKRK